MRKILSLSSIAFLVIFVCSCSFINKVKGNHVITENEVNISDYSVLKIAGHVDLVYEQKADTSAYLRIEIDENLFPLLDIKSGDGALSIKPVRGQNIVPTKFNIYTNSSDLKVLKTAGSSEVFLKGGLKTDNLSISSAGSGNVRADSILCDNLKIDIAGSGYIELAGKAPQASYNISGSGKVRNFTLFSDTVKCNIAGSGNMQIYVEKLLDVKIAGSGDITYRGNGQLNQSISGSGKITRIDD